MSLATLLERIFPNRCALCQEPGRPAPSQANGQISAKTQPLCENCYSQLPRLGPHCRICADEITASDELICGQCQQQQPAYDQAISPFRYAEPIDQLITGLKFSAHLAYAPLLASLFLEHKSHIKLPDLLIPMPLHPKRLRERGFNQSLLLAQALGERLKLPIDIKHCQRSRHTEPQSGLAFKQRRKNIRGAFQVDGEIKAHHVVIVDDVMTTGHSVNELAKVLKQTGVERVDAWLMARAVSTR